MFSAMGKVQGNTVVISDSAIDEYDGYTVYVTISAEKKSSKGMAAKYASVDLRHLEKQAMEDALVERYKNANAN